MPAPAGVQPGGAPRPPGSDADADGFVSQGPVSQGPVSQGPVSPPPSGAAPVARSAAPAAGSPAAPGTDGGPETGEAPRKRGNRFLRVLKIIAVVIALPVLALLIGLLVAWIVHVIRGGDDARTGTATTSPTPSASATPTTGPSASTSAGPSTPAPTVTVPAGWVTEAQPPAGVTYRYPDGWIRRTSGTAVFRFAPVSAGSTAPGVEGVGVQLAPAGTTPDAAIRQLVGSNYGGQPGYTASAPAAVPAPTPGKHDGELRSVVGYTRSGVPVRVVVDAYPVTTPSGTRTVVVLGRAASATPERAAQLEAYVEASLKVG